MLLKEENIQLRDTHDIPLAFEHIPTIFNHFSKKEVFLFLDFDGTLSPIVNDPAKAGISESMKSTLKAYNEKHLLAIVSGRDLDDLRKRVGLSGIIYAGSHGFRIKGPEGLKMKHRKSQEIIPHLEDIADSLKKEFSDDFPGVNIEKKTFAIAVHYRNADEEQLPDLEKVIRKILKEYPDMKTGTGKKIIEIKPDLDWNKGKAVEWIMDSLERLDDPGVIPVYIGDDVTDEDAFKSIQDVGLGILVGHHGKHSAANYRLRDVNEVKLFIEKLSDRNLD